MPVAVADGYQMGTFLKGKCITFPMVYSYKYCRFKYYESLFWKAERQVHTCTSLDRQHLIICSRTCKTSWVEFNVVLLQQFTLHKHCILLAGKIPPPLFPMLFWGFLRHPWANFFWGVQRHTEGAEGRWKSFCWCGCLGEFCPLCLRWWEVLSVEFWPVVVCAHIHLKMMGIRWAWMRPFCVGGMKNKHINRRIHGCQDPGLGQVLFIEKTLAEI